MSKIQNSLNKYSTGKNILVLFIITQAIYILMIMITIPHVMKYSDNMKLLDNLPTGYSPDYVFQLLNILWEEWRSEYLFKQIPIDMIYPWLFIISYSLLLFYLFKKSFKPNKIILILSLIPVFWGVFDYLENIWIIVMISMYPSFVSYIASITNFFSILKSLFTVIFFILLITWVVILGVKKILIRLWTSKTQNSPVFQK